MSSKIHISQDCHFIRYRCGPSNTKQGDFEVKMHKRRHLSQVSQKSRIDSKEFHQLRFKIKVLKKSN